MSKNIAIFCDGTWNRADQSKDDRPCPTNVVKLALRTAKSDGNNPQVVYYSQGVGTGNSLDRLTGGAFGRGLDDNLFAAYRFLMSNYVEGDRIFLFGFSRGAYTARSLAGLIRKCGILKPQSAMQYSAAIALYCDDQHPDARSPSCFRESFAIGSGAPTPIQCIGVWDTVGSLGVPIGALRWITASNYQFHDVELSGSVRYAFHALSIDEQRGPFKDSRWAYKPKPDQRVEQVWFSGFHCDVGGGFPAAESGLSDITLDWMLQRAQLAGLKFDQSLSGDFTVSPDPLGPMHPSRKGFYRCLPRYEREIALPANKSGEIESLADVELDPTQTLHDSVLKRWDHDKRYRPENLRKYFKRIGDPRSMDAPAVK